MTHNLPQILEYMGISQSELARRMDCTSQSISRVCSGARIPSLRMLCEISNALGVMIEVHPSGWTVRQNSRRARHEQR